MIIRLMPFYYFTFGFLYIQILKFNIFQVYFLQGSLDFVWNRTRVGVRGLGHLIRMSSLRRVGHTVAINYA